jgi:hypothetical protein
VGTFSGEQSDPDSLHEKRKNIIDLIKPDLTRDAQPFIVRYYHDDTSKFVQGAFVYNNGLEFTAGSALEQTSISCMGYEPFVHEDGQEGAALSVNQSVATADFIVRKNGSTWANISTDFGATVFALEFGADGRVYIGGSFTNVGDANGDRIVVWDPVTEALSSLQTGANNTVQSLKRSPNGDIYVGGSFTGLGGAGGDSVAYYDVSTGLFAVMSTGITGSVQALEFGDDGILYIGGTFTNHIDANGDNITQWDGSAYSSLGTGASSVVRSIAKHPSGNIYAASASGVFGGGSSDVAYWDGSAWNDVGTGSDDTVNALAIDQNGLVYIGGEFTTFDGVSANNIGVWNGESFSPLGDGTNGIVWKLWIDGEGLLWASGYFTSAGGSTVNDKIATWNGSSWIPVGIDLPGDPTAYALISDRDNLYIGYSTGGTALAAYSNTITNNGTVTAYPVLSFKRSGGTSATMVWIKNQTTGSTIYLDYSLLDGETVTIDFRPGNRTVKSDFFDKRWNAIMRSSDFTEFNLLPGDNVIEVFINEAGSPTITALMWWDITHWSADGVAA